MFPCLAQRGLPDTTHPYYDAERYDFNLIQHNAIRCNGFFIYIYIYIYIYIVQIRDVP